MRTNSSPRLETHEKTAALKPPASSPRFSRPHLEEPDGLEERWREYAVRPLSSPNLWMDAYLAAFARQSGCQFVTTDLAFRQFVGLDVVVLDNGEATA